MEKAAQDLIVRIWQRHLGRRRQELSQRLRTLTGAEHEQAIRELAELLTDQGKLKLGWAQAQSVLTRHLDRVCGI